MNSSGAISGASGPRWAGRAVRLLAAAVAAAAVGYWLFADTVRYHSETDESTALRVCFWGDFEEYKMWKEFRAAWLRKYPDIPVKYEYVAVGSQYTPKIKQLLVANAAPDVILFQDEPMPGFIKEGRFEDLTPYVKRSGLDLGPEKGAYWKTAVKSFGRWEGQGEARTWHHYGIPIWGGCNMMFYNRRLFERGGIRVESKPGSQGLREDGEGGWVLNDEAWTIDDFVKLTKMLTVDHDGDGRIDQFGFWMPGSIYWLPWHWALGATVLDADRRHLTWYGPECERSLQLWQDLLFKHHVAPTPAELGMMGYNVGFMTGRVAMFSNGPWAMPFHNATGSPYGILHMPRGPGGVRATRITWDAVVMFAGSKKKALAWRYIHHLTGLECQRICAKYQRSIPALRAAKDAFIEKNPDVATRKFVTAIEDERYGRMQPISEHWELMSRVWYEARSGLLSPRPDDRLTPRQAIGLMLSRPELIERLPPLSEAAAKPYRREYKKFLEGGK